MHHRRRPARFWIAPLVGLIVLAGFSRCQAQFSDRSIPSLGYQAAFGPFYEGDYRDALERFQDEWRGAIKTVQSRWIDSICYHTMIGDCYYHMGRLDDALEHYTAALRLYLTFSDWMINVQFPASIRPSSTVVQIPWGTSGRNSRLGQYPNSMLMSQGRVNNNQQIQQGGVVQQAVLFPIQAQEIVRATTLAIRRRTELLGPLSQYDPMTSELIAALQRRPGPPNHWSQAWIDVELGLALVAGGKSTEAILPLTRGLLAAGEYDHPLTATALLELGRLALLRGDYATASKFFHEAGISAVYYPDPGIVEEAFRYGAVAHLLANKKSMFGVLEPAAQWAKVKDLRQLRVSLLLSAAENLATLDQSGPASVMLDEAQQTIGRRTMGGGRIGARLNYLRAMVLFQQRRIADGDQALAAAMGYMRYGSHWLHQILQVDLRFSTGQIGTRGPITDRSAMELYSELLRDPQPSDWALDPMEAFSVLTTPHAASFEHWFLIALNRKEHEKALEIADRARRSRYFSSLVFGGRLQALRWILEAPETLLDQTALLERQSLLADYPAYARLSQQARAVRDEAGKLPLVSQDAESLRRQGEVLGRLTQVSLQQEAVLRETAVRRQPSKLVFPPVRTTKEIQQDMPPGQVLLAFFSAGGDLYGFLLNKEKYTYWRLKAAPVLARQTVAMLRAMGLYDANCEMSVTNLADTRWREAAQELLAGILDGSQADFTDDFPEMVIVPDGVLWYVPFEALQVKIGDELTPLISRFRIRYAPTASLAVPDGRGSSPAARTVVVLGRLHPRDEDAVAQAAYEDFARAVPRTVPLFGASLPGPAAVYASLMDRLVVFDDIQAGDGSPYGWLPIQIDRGKPGGTLGDWLSLPWQGPEVLILPGFHTAAEGSLKGVIPAAPGSEIFLSVCGLMSSGARTMLLSRWRTGGRSSFDIVREFAQELPHASPADAWQRAVLVTADTRLDLDAEPRVKRTATDEAPKGDHPFFWAGYMLIDSGEPDKPPGAEPNARDMAPEAGPPQDKAP
jgi:tetratricopeptide (TPR) repeat protein